VQVTIHSGGVLGDETEMVGQIRDGRIQAAALSSAGLSRIDNAVSCLQIPMMFSSYAELDYVRTRLTPALERRIEAKGFKVLNWADGGWVHTFTRKSARTPDDVRRMKLFSLAGDAETGRLYHEFGFHAVALAPTDLITALQTGTIEAFSTVPLFAELDGSYKHAPNMIDVPWMPLVGGTVISQQAWGQVPAGSRAALLDAAHAAGERLRGDIRAMGDQAVREMEKRGLTVVHVDAATRRLWQSSAESTYSRLRGSYCPADLFDEVQRLRNELRR
jgi:TRAP-type C4-dicarboxylate transport system substrate-binding protein